MELCELSLNLAFAGKYPRIDQEVLKLHIEHVQGSPLVLVGKM